MRIDFVVKEDRIQVLSPEIELGYIKDNAFFPNNAMMFKAEWLVEIAEFMQNVPPKNRGRQCFSGQNYIDLHRIRAYYQINKDISL